MLALGLMSGTSADGIDVALVHFSRSGWATLHDFAAYPYPVRVRRVVLRLANVGPTTTAEFSNLNFLIGELFAKAALDALRKFRVAPARVQFIGSHGQTVYHQGAPAPFLGAAGITSTLQIGEPAVIAERTSITTIGDFRVADMAAGGQGAPLVPFVDYILYRHSRTARIALNVGGIANLTAIPANARPGEVLAFDTGPGNMIVDALVNHYSRGRRSYDRDARMAQRGHALPVLLDEMFRDPYLAKNPPKSCGREQFGAAYAQRVIKWGAKHRSRPEDLVRAATVFTALSILDAMNRWASPRVRGARKIQLVAAGGGSHNPLIMAQLAAGLPHVEIVSSGELGVPEDAKEAFAFAILAHETWHRRPSNLPGATGAAHPCILGKICYAAKK